MKKLINRKQINTYIANITGESYHRLDKICINLKDMLTNRCMTAQGAAMIIIALTGSKSVLGSANVVTKYGTIATKKTTICGMETKDKYWTFGKALSLIIKNKKASSMVVEIEIVKIDNRDIYLQAEIKWKIDSGKIESAIFNQINNTEQPKMVSKTILCGSVLREISNVLQDNFEDSWY